MEKLVLRKEKLSKCPLCGSQNIIEELKANDKITSTGDYSLFQCKDCEVRFTNPRPIAEDLHLIYQNRQQGMDLADKNNLSLFLKKLKISFYIKRLMRLIKKKDFTLLDYGCGDGLIVLGFAELNECREAWGADFAMTPPALIKNEANSKIKYLTLSDLEKGRKKFDVIVLRHVLEHTQNPKTTISEIKEKHLSSGGMIIFEVPNIESIWFKLFKGNYNQLGFPQHLIHFNKRSLKQNFNGIKIHSANIPVLGPSLALAMGRRASNIGLMAALFYLPQLIIDKLLFNSNAFLVKMDDR